MKPFNVEDLLRQARPPEPDSDYETNFLAQVQRRIAAAPRGDPLLDRQPRPRRSWLPVLSAVAAAACGLIAGFILWHRSGTADSYAKLKSGQALTDNLPMYVGRLQAIEQDGSHLRLVLSKEKNVPTSLPVWVELDDGKQRRTLDIFSGQTFRVGAEPVEVLANPDGEVMLIGRDFIWSNRDTVPEGSPVRVQAHLLPQKF